MHRYTHCGYFLLLSIFVLSWIMLPARVGAVQSAKTPDLKAINAYVEIQMQREGIPGLALGIVRGQQIVHLQGFGRADQVGRVVTPQTAFIVGSLSKSITAVATMQLVEAGLLELDAPVQKYLSWFEVADPEVSRKITVRHLLNQTSGFSTLVGLAPFSTAVKQTLEHYIRSLNTVTLVSAPGTTYHYSNVNYSILGLLIQEVSGQDYGMYIEKQVFKPLQMKQSFTSYEAAQKQGLAIGYRQWFGVPVAADLPSVASALPAGYLISSAEDMAHYLIAQNNQGMYEQTAVLTPKSVELLHKPVAPFETGAGTYYGMGWMIGSVGGESAIFHGGDVGNFHADMALLSQDGWGVIVLMNVNGVIGRISGVYSSVIDGVVRLLMGQQSAASIDLRVLYVIIDGSVLLFAVGCSWSLIRLLRRWQTPWKPGLSIRRWLIGGTEIVLPIVLWFILPVLVQAPWDVLFHFMPDVSYALVVLFMVSTGIGALRIGYTFYAHDKPGLWKQ